MAELSPYQAARLKPGTVIRAKKDIRLYANTFGSGSVWPGFLKAGHEAIVRATQTVSDSGWSSEVIKRHNADPSRAFLLIDPPYCVENNPAKPITSAFIDAEPTDNLQSYIVVGHIDSYKPILFITPDDDGQSNPETYDPDSDNISGTDGRTDNTIDFETDYSTTTPQEEYPTGTTGIPIDDPNDDNGDDEIIGYERNPPGYPGTSSSKPTNNLIKPVIGLTIGMFILNLLVKK